jgi:hypothetical protein
MDLCNKEAAHVDEGVLHEVICSICGKQFGFVTHVVYFFESPIATTRSAQQAESEKE